MDAEERRQRAAEQEKRADDMLWSIHSGGDMFAETLALANEFTDRHTARFGSWLRGLRRPPETR
ncbi:hypothetical protein [Naasia lichenicola]|uniref:Uncharacterized protein n=1 Tax=Naasia lichenicola TaxID=2565933 RepID=A0A4S4FS82_9MICO|nr:hypothetical protein [Naasia lichenicola]THG33533.1 hypothetical protein E6C64_04135 [Naasia lichenicola]